MMIWPIINAIPFFPGPNYYGGGKPDTYRREHPKVGRNSPCPCGSGLKFKKCCIEKGGDTNEGGDS